MTTEEKRAWLDWAVEIGFLCADVDERDESGPWIQWVSSDDKWLVAVYNPEHEEVTEDYRRKVQEELNLYEFLEFAIRDEIDRLALLLKQEDVIDSKGDKGFFVIVRDCNQSLGFSKFRDSRLEALMIAFKQAVEAGKR